MIWIIAIIGVICIAVFGDWWDWGETVLGTFFALLVALLLSGALCCLSECWVSYSSESTIEETVEIIAMHDGSSASGNMGGGIFCVSGTIDEKPVYKVLVETDKGLQTKTYKADETYVQFTDEAPRVEKHRVEAIGFWNFFCWDGLLDKTEYIIYIPTDSVVANDFVLDLQ